MEIHGTLNLVDSEVKSDGFASDKSFNRLIVNNLSEVDQETLDHEVILFNKEDSSIYTYAPGFNSWKTYSGFEVNELLKIDDRPRINIALNDNIYNEYKFNGVVTNFLTVDADLFDFGPIGSPEDFVIDFWLNSSYVNGTILYNGLNTGQVDLEINKNLLITTSGSFLLKDPNFQLDPTVQTNAADDGYLNVYQPRLKSLAPVRKKFLTHVAIIRSGDTTYLAIDGKINASAPSVEYFHYDPVKIGAGYVGAFGGGIVNLRVSKGTDRGWTIDFDPPNYNPTVDVNTDFLMSSGSLIDETSNYIITTNGNPPIIDQDRFYYLLNETHYSTNAVITGLGGEICIRFPNEINNGTMFEIEDVSMLTIYTGINVINTNVGYSVNKARHRIPNDHHLYIFNAGQWYEKTPLFTNLTTPILDIRFLNSKYGVTKSMGLDGRIYNVNTKEPVMELESLIETDSNIPYGFGHSYLDCNKVPSGTEIIVNTAYGYAESNSYEFVLKLNSNISSSWFFKSYGNDNVGFLLVSNKLILAAVNGTINTTPLTVGDWYHIYIYTYRSAYSNGYYSSTVYYSWRNLNTNFNQSNGTGTGSVRYSPWYFTDLYRLCKLPISLLFFQYVSTAGYGTSYVSTYKALFNEV